MGKWTHTHTHTHMLVVVSLLATAIGSIAAVASGIETAHACSIVGPSATTRPAERLHPGQVIEISGWGFEDIEFREPLREPAPRPDPPSITDAAVPDLLCDFDTSPLTGLAVIWNGGFRQQLGVVDGPEFVLIARVPDDAVDGPASITIGPATIGVHVGPAVPPPPCTPTASPDAPVSSACPEPDPPWPCPGHDAQEGAAPPVPGAAVAPGFLPPCPEPCIDHAHTIDEGTAYGYRWDCPHPCAYPEANPGAAPGAAPTDAVAPEAIARWCPPDPCALYGVPESGASEAIASEAIAPAAVWCPPPCLDAPADATTNLCPVPDPRVLAGAAGSAASTEAATATDAGPAMATSTRDHAFATVVAMSQRLSRLVDHIVALVFR